MLPGKMRTATPSVDVGRAETRAWRDERERSTHTLGTDARRGLAAARRRGHAPRPAPPARRTRAPRPAPRTVAAHLSLSLAV
ncbi:hypothetical protein RR46_04062 [Papilio xuthus]|uniref:Uncharacterized protein n=1 Tax=Papilio xuthus TaxID=66420 RepID=A0A194QN84_PAPXU|nr:hypothetical protein RR46_04062 [Papilio xuthus]